MLSFISWNMLFFSSVNTFIVALKFLSAKCNIWDPSETVCIDCFFWVWATHLCFFACLHILCWNLDILEKLGTTDFWCFFFLHDDCWLFLFVISFLFFSYFHLIVSWAKSMKSVSSSVFNYWYLCPILFCYTCFFFKRSPSVGIL